jgi:alpha-L-fucosidase
MKRTTLSKSLCVSSLICMSSLFGFSQSAPKPYGAIPTPAQLEWHEMEMYALIHFGVDTYTDKEWGFGDENPKILNPVKFDAKQIVAAAKAAGFKGVVVVAKHHDGLCIWPTKTTEHSISNTPWKDGKGDMLQEYREACDALGMKLGVYVSPWDRNSPHYGTPKYLEIYREQLREVYSNYGKLFISWHDGANGGDGYYGGANEARKIDRNTYYDWPNTWAITRKMQPGAVIFGDVGPDVRWVGNEEGHAGETSWATYTPLAPDAGKTPANGYVQHLRGIEGTRNGKYWMPAEADVSLRPGWFYHASQNHQVKSPAVLMDLYYKSVGRGANLDLGLSPNRDGLLDDTDVNALKGFGELVQETFKENLAKGATLKASNIRGNSTAKFGPVNLLDEDRYSYWSTDDAIHTPTLTLVLPEERTFNVIRLRENIKLGQRIEAVEVEALQDDKWTKIGAATSIGANRLIRLSEPVKAKQLRLHIRKSPVSIALSDFGLYMEPKRLETARAQVTANAGEVSKSGWKIIAPAADDQAKNAIDGNPATIWTAESTAGFKPASIDIDLGFPIEISAFSYLPRQDKKTDGVADQYSFYVSEDGKTYREVASGEFSNIRANPIEQVISLKEKVQARYIRFVGKRSLDGKGITIAELGIRK